MIFVYLKHALINTGKNICTWSAALLFFLSLCIAAVGQEIDLSGGPASPPPSPAPSLTPIPLSDVVKQADAASARLLDIRRQIDESLAKREIEEAIPELASTIDSRADVTSDILAARPSLDDITAEERRWQGIAASLKGWRDRLSSRADVLDKLVEELKMQKAQWRTSLAGLNGQSANSGQPTNDGQAAPLEITSRTREIISSTAAAQKMAEERRAVLLTLQTRVSDLTASVNSTLANIKERREAALVNLFVRDGPGIWNVALGEAAGPAALSETRSSVNAQAVALRDYFYLNTGRFVLHGTLFIILTAVIYWARRRIRPFVENDRKLERAFAIFRHPASSALILTILLSGWLYPESPRLLTTSLGAAALIPGVILLRRIVDKPLFLILYALVAFYFIDRIRDITASAALISRLLFLAEMFAAVLFLSWFLKSKVLVSKVESRHFRFFETIRKIIPFALAIFALAFVVNLLGFVSLSYLIGNGILRTAYVALILYTVVEILKSLVTFALRIRPLSSLEVVKSNGALIRARIVRIIQWVGIIVWLLITLSLFSVRDAVFSFFGDILFAEANIGSIRFSLSDVILFVATVWIAILVSRFIRFVLEEDVYPRINIGGGVSYAISTMIHYVLLIIGFIIAVAALGVELSNFAILAGAVGIGLGFGLQNIINNFVSGLILLFERPVKVGDLVQIGEYQGNLNQIGLRASVLRQFDGSDVIVPNSHLISEEVINWTKSDTKRRIEIPVGVAYGTDVKKVMELLTALAVGKQDIMTDPAPVTLFKGLGDNSLDFELRAWTENTDRWLALNSELVTDIYTALNQANIEIPFPQRDFHLRSADVDISRNL